MHGTINRRNLLTGGFTVAAGLACGRTPALAAKVPRTHGPSTRRLINLNSDQKPGTILISNSARTLDVVQSANRALRYTIGIGRDGFEWTGTVSIQQKSEWPSWRPPAEMIARQPDLPEMVPPGPLNPLGARALYLYKGGRDTLYRIHGTNDAATIGGLVTSGCFRMTNADILELYPHVAIGTKVIVV